MKALFRKVDSYERLSQLAALEIKKKIQKGNQVNLGLPTGGTPIGMYKELVNDSQLDWWNVSTFNLDEYIEISIDHPESYQNFMNRNLFDHIDIDKFNIWFPHLVNDYDGMIDGLGGLDLTILGIGSNGHIAFNEPNSPFDSKTRIVDLDEQTIEDNAETTEETGTVVGHYIQKVPTNLVYIAPETITPGTPWPGLPDNSSDANIVNPFTL